MLNRQSVCNVTAGCFTERCCWWPLTRNALILFELAKKAKELFNGEAGQKCSLLSWLLFEIIKYYWPINITGVWRCGGLVVNWPTVKRFIGQSTRTILENLPAAHLYLLRDNYVYWHIFIDISCNFPATFDWPWLNDQETGRGCSYTRSTTISSNTFHLRCRMCYLNMALNRASEIVVSCKEIGKEIGFRWML